MSVFGAVAGCVMGSRCVEPLSEISSEEAAAKEDAMA